VLTSKNRKSETAEKPEAALDPLAMMAAAKMLVSQALFFDCWWYLSSITSTKVTATDLSEKCGFDNSSVPPAA
jgi:hypothetical protein